MNFTRNVEIFYNNGMNVLTKVEGKNIKTNDKEEL
jgi:hypothetical protein